MNTENLNILEPSTIFGFDGKIPSGVSLHPDEKHLIFPLGTKVSILNTENNQQQFLCGHTNSITAITVSRTGSSIASGQMNHVGCRSYVIIWDFETKKETARHNLHRVCVKSLCFTANEVFLISLGDIDENSIVVWDINNRIGFCGSLAAKEVTGHAQKLCSLNKHQLSFLTAGDQNIRIWYIDVENKKLKVLDASMGKLRRVYTSMKIDSNDQILYAGTMSGDIVKVKINASNDPLKYMEVNPVLIECYARYNPKKSFGKDCEKYMNGVRDLDILDKEKQLIIGSGDGTVELVEERGVKFKNYPSPTWPQLKMIKRKKVNGAITTLIYRNGFALIATESCEMYLLNIKTFEMNLKLTCNTSSVNDIAFPDEFSFVFATASHQSVRVWSLIKKTELLRIIVPNFIANALLFSFDGKSIITAWNDGIIRAFTPLTGKLIYSIPNAHNKGCSTLAMSKCDKILVSGGNEGQIRLWNIEPIRQSLITVLKQHKAPITSLQFNHNNEEIVSAAGDGTCIIWDVRRQTQKHVLYANTRFTCAQFDPTGIQVLASGTNRRISYWEVFDATLVRDIEGSAKDAINSLSINSSGEFFATGGNDEIVKIWNYEKGIPVAIGLDHAAAITICKFSPCGKFLITGSCDGAVIIWKLLPKFWPKNSSKPFAALKADKSKPKSKYEYRPENISEIQSSRSNKSLQISECPTNLKN